jgi:GNAT superfamily N-acetyltransferase
MGRSGRTGRYTGRGARTPITRWRGSSGTDHHGPVIGIPSLRRARVADAPRIQELMHASARRLFPTCYDARQTASAVTYMAHLDPELLDDGTYFLHEVDSRIVACGGWSRRAKLFAGSGAPDPDPDRLLDPETEPARIRAMFVHDAWTRRGLARAILEASERDAAAEGFRDLVLMSTLPGVPLYQAYGFRAVEQTQITLPDGVVVGGVRMERPIRITGSRGTSPAP